MPAHPVAALILAAGSSHRLGRLKQLEPWGGTTLLGHVVDRARSLPVDEVWVVIGADAEAVLAGVDLNGCGVVENPEWEEGLSSSLRVGLDALSRKSRVEAALIMLGDQPEIRPDVVESVIAAYRPGRTPVVLPKYRYTWANPALVDRTMWPRLMSLSGDHGAMELFRAHPEWVTEVWVDSLPPRDVDTEADVDELHPRHPGGPDPGQEV